ncbi:MAG: hypothetical protein AAFU41_14920 [Pseudomonadota bacterium]
MITIIFQVDTLCSANPASVTRMTATRGKTSLAVDFLFTFVAGFCYLFGVV